MPTAPNAGIYRAYGPLRLRRKSAIRNHYYADFALLIGHIQIPSARLPVLLEPLAPRLWCGQHWPVLPSQAVHLQAVHPALAAAFLGAAPRHVGRGRCGCSQKRRRRSVHERKVRHR